MRAGNASVTMDLTRFHDAFFEESFEALDSMEAALLKLDVGAPEPELINTIFRVAHSIKGGGATFGFSELLRSRTASRRCSMSCAPSASQ